MMLGDWYFLSCPRACAVPCQGDAEDLPFPTDSFDRYVSAGSIEYWWVDGPRAQRIRRCMAAGGPPAQRLCEHLVCGRLRVVGQGLRTNRTTI